MSSIYYCSQYYLGLQSRFVQGPFRLLQPLNEPLSKVGFKTKKIFFIIQFSKEGKMSGTNVPAFIPVMSTRAIAPLLPIAKETSSADNAKNRIQLLFLNVALNQVTNTYQYNTVHHSIFRGISGEWAGWAGRAIAHPDFGRIEGATQQRWHTALLLAHPVFGSHLRP